MHTAIRSQVLPFAGPLALARREISEGMICVWDVLFA